MLTFHDYKPKSASLLEAVINGMSRDPKSIEPKFFYDRRGSELFDLICEQPEYYPPTVEQDMLREKASEIAFLTGKGRILIEPGAGRARKVRLLLDALQPKAYIPIDISFEHLKSAVADLVEEYRWLRVHAACADFTCSLPVPDVAPQGARLIFFPGSSIGNFEHEDVMKFMARIRNLAQYDGMLLIGVDTKKDETILNAAYNDQAGITAEFNRNLLYRMREELDIDCDPEMFEHRAFYNSLAGRVEMHLVSRGRQTLRMNGRQFELASGESLHTENSYKYTPAEFLAVATKSGFKTVCYWQDDKGLFSIYLLAVK